MNSGQAFAMDMPPTEALRRQQQLKPREAFLIDGESRPMVPIASENARRAAREKYSPATLFAYV
jgi:hypothetical protein